MIHSSQTPSQRLIWQTGAKHAVPASPRIDCQSRLMPQHSFPANARTTKASVGKQCLMHRFTDNSPGAAAIPFKGSAATPDELLVNLHRAALRIGVAVGRVRILGSVLKSESGLHRALESVSRGAWHCTAQHFQNAVQRNAKLPGRDSKTCFKALSDFRTDPEILTRLIANPTLRSARLHSSKSGNFLQ
jgi:hypothetical protein